MNQQAYNQPQSQQVKSRQNAGQQQSAGNVAGGNGPKKQNPQNPKKSQPSTYQNLSQTSTPKGTKKVAIGGAISAPQQQVFSQSQMTAAYTNQQRVGTAPNQQMLKIQQQQQQMLFENRKRSAETTQFYAQQVQAYQQQQQVIQSKSTRVSPTRGGNSGANPQTSYKPSQFQGNQVFIGQSAGAPIQAKISSGLEGVKQNQMNSMDQKQVRALGNQQQDQIMPAQINTLQFYNFELEGITPVLVSQTACASSNAIKGGTGQLIKIMSGSSTQQNPALIGNLTGSQVALVPSQPPPYVGNGGQQQSAEDMNMDSSMHQSFINLIYPSKSKKLMSSEAAAQSQVTHKDPSSATSSNGHHQKSKSLYVGSSQHMVQNFVKPVAHQLAPKGASGPPGSVQKIQQSNYKKQSSIFNYSQRFKELLNDTMGEDPLRQQIIGHQLYSQQQSPSAIAGGHNISQGLTAGGNIFVNYHDYNLQRSMGAAEISGGKNNQTLLKNTFDKPLVSQSQQPSAPSNHYLSLSDQALLVASGGPNQGIIQRQEGANKTLDYSQPTSLLQSAAANPFIKNQSQGLHNTPNSIPTKGVIIQSKQKVIQGGGIAQNNLLMQGGLHQRKPSHPVTNNYMIELLQGPPPTNPLVQSFAASQQPANSSTDITQHRGPASSATIDHPPQRQQLSQYNQIQPVREKKQHQPTQSKIAKSSTGGNGGNHQRSQSDYMVNLMLRNSGGISGSEPLQESLPGQSQRQQNLQQVFHNQQLENMLESFDNQQLLLDCTTVTHSGQVNMGMDSSRAPVSSQNGMNYHQQAAAFSQMLYDGSIPLGSSSHRYSQPSTSSNNIAYPQSIGQQPSSQPQGIYHHRKMSMPNPQNQVGMPQTQMTLQQQPTGSTSMIQQQNQQQVKKSPQKLAAPANQSKMSLNNISVDQYQKMQQKRKSSPSNSGGQQFNQGGNSTSNYINIKTSSSTSTNNGGGGPSQKGVQAVLVKTSSMNIGKDQGFPQQQAVVTQSMRSSQVSSPTNGQKSGAKQPQTAGAFHHHSSSTSSITNPMVGTSSSSMIIQQPQGQLVSNTTAQVVHHNRSNSDLMKQQIMAAQAAAMKKQQMIIMQGGVQFVPSTQGIQPNRPNPAINTQQAATSTGGGNSKAKSEMTTPRQLATAGKPTTNHSKQASVGSNLVATAANVSIDLIKNQNAAQGATQRSAMNKNGSSGNINNSKQAPATTGHTPRLNKQGGGKASPTQSKSIAKQQPIDGGILQGTSNTASAAQMKRYSVQNSPRIIQSGGVNMLTGANGVQSQQNIAKGISQQLSNQQYNLSQQYQMFQQVMAKQAQGPGSKAAKLQNNTESQSQTISPTNNLRQSVVIASSVIPPGDAPQGEHKRGVSQTEFLLNQIRNNINTLKAYQPYSGPQNEHPPVIPQVVVEGDPYTNFTNKPAQKHQAPKQIAKGGGNHLQIVTNSSIDDEIMSSQRLTTDPNLSPYSKDLLKLQKMIKFNFKLYNEAPQTTCLLSTSEFYRIGRVLGRGAFGKVNLAAHKLSEQLVAIKSINKEVLRSSKHNKEKLPAGGAVSQPQDQKGADQMIEHPEKKKVMQEFAILKQSNHQSVVRLYDTFETNKHICFVMELCAGGDLLTYVRKRRKLTEEVAKYFFKQLIEGLAYLHHTKLIVHRDIKLDNILLDADGRIKIADFGVSRQVQTDNEKMSEQCGTPAYIAPEILKDKGYEGFKVDVWSAGVCLYAMLIGTVPFKASSMQELHHLIINGKYDINNPNANCQKDGTAAATQPQPPTKLTDHATNLIHSLLQVDPRKRLSAVEVLSHPWLKDSKDELDVFTQKEKDVIHKEYLAKNIDRTSKSLENKDHQQLLLLNTAQLNLQQIHQLHEDTEVIFTEHNLDTRTNVGDLLLKNASTKSIILAPFNSTVSEIQGEDGQSKPFQWPDEIKRMILPKRVLKFAPKVKDLDRQYEHNNNADLDNGVYNNVGEDNLDGGEAHQGNESDDSLKRSFKETELSSDDEHAQRQVEEARQKQQSELREFEQQIKLKYVRYQEPVEVIDVELMHLIASQGFYPLDFILRVLQNKEMNYATATYHLLLKKQQQIARQQLQLSNQKEQE